jgi:hypothetical protein
MDLKLKWSIYVTAALAVFVQQLVYLLLHRTWLQFAMDVMLVIPLLFIAAGVSRIAFIYGCESVTPGTPEPLSASMAANVPSSVPLQDTESWRDVVASEVATGQVDLRLDRLMSPALATRNRYWHPDRFDPANQDSMPAKKDILEWIKGQWPWMSGAEAESVEKVACPVKR